MAIQSFEDKSAQIFFETGKLKSKGVGWAELKRLVKRKLDVMHYASILNDLRSPPGNHLEELKGNYVGHHSIRINSQWRIVFKWTPSGPIDVCVKDYH
jgi:toxin HigB-1